jgi:hypothetical protein
MKEMVSASLEDLVCVSRRAAAAAAAAASERILAFRGMRGATETPAYRERRSIIMPPKVISLEKAPGVRPMLPLPIPRKYMTTP